MRIGYARVSTTDQNLDLQRDALRRARCVRIYEDRASGKNAVRPQLLASIENLGPGDCLVVWRLDRVTSKPGGFEPCQIGGSGR